MSTIFLSILIVGCQDYSLETIKEDVTAGPAIEVTPNPVLFGELPAGESASQTVTITSVGDATLNVTALRLVDGTDFTVVTDETFGRFEPDESTTFVVTWTSNGGTAEDQAIILSNATEEEETIVPLVGGTSVPDLEITPRSVSFGSVSEGESKDEDVVLSNVGEAPLTISGMSTTESVFAVDTGSLPITLEPGEERTVTVTFSPDASDTWTGELQVASNDPDGLESATLNGSSGSQPQAVCSVTPESVEAIHGSADWVGEDSYDPSGLRITSYDWSLISAPAGSAVSMPSGGANRRNFAPDVVGTYEAQLIVENENGERSEPCFAMLEAVPGGDLWIEMFWVHSGDDMDLHLVAPVSNPDARLTTDDDCYYGNCTGSFGGLDWGVRGDPDDDPILDIDDIPGTGPENVNIDTPENGTFTVYVHDYPGSVYSGANDVTVNIYVGGSLEWTDTRPLRTEDEYTPFAEITFPGGTVSAL